MCSAGGECGTNHSLFCMYLQSPHNPKITLLKAKWSCQQMYQTRSNFYTNPLLFVFCVFLLVSTFICFSFYFTFVWNWANWSIPSKGSVLTSVPFLWFMQPMQPSKMLYPAYSSLSSLPENLLPSYLGKLY